MSNIFCPLSLGAPALRAPTAFQLLRSCEQALVACACRARTISVIMHFRTFLYLTSKCKCLFSTRTLPQCTETVLVRQTIVEQTSNDKQYIFIITLIYILLIMQYPSACAINSLCLVASRYNYPPF